MLNSVRLLLALGSIMSLRRKIILWVGLILSILATVCGSISVIYYSWLSAWLQEHWPKQEAVVWIFSALALTIMFLLIFIYCTVSLIKETKSNEGSNTI